MVMTALRVDRSLWQTKTRDLVLPILMMWSHLRTCQCKISAQTMKIGKTQMATMTMLMRLMMRAVFIANDSDMYRTNQVSRVRWVELDATLQQGTMKETLN